MTQLSAFLIHEWRTQVRSIRYRALSLIYVAIVSAPVFAPFVLERRFFVGAVAFSGAIDLLQAPATALLAAVFAIDAISREQDEGSVVVLSFAATSNSGYLLRRWLATVVVLLPLTIVPRAIAAGLALAAGVVPAAVFFTGWIAKGLLPLLIFSAFAIALGTIASRTLVAAAFGVLILTLGFGVGNDLLAHFHRKLAGPESMLTVDMFQVSRLVWMMRGFGVPELPTVAAPDTASVFRRVVIESGLMASIALMLLAIAPAFLRRGRRDLRPWRIGDDHPLRSMLRLVNRGRQELVPDPAPLPVDLIFLGVGVAAFVVAVAALLHVFGSFEVQGERRYVAEQSQLPHPTSRAIVPVATSIRGSIDDDGVVRLRDVLTLRNGGDRPESHLAFTLNPALEISRASVPLARSWDRLTIDLEPPLAPGAMTTIELSIQGRPGQFTFPFTKVPFAAGWTRYRRAKVSSELVDLSRSEFVGAASTPVISMAASDLVPVPRYTPWQLVQDEQQVAVESVAPVSEIDVALTLPRGVTVVDSCGSIGTRELSSRCSFAPARYIVFGGEMKVMATGERSSMLYPPAHEPVARLNATAIGNAVSMARSSWPGLDVSRPVVVVERPTQAGDPSYLMMEGKRFRSLAARWISASGALQLVPEPMLVARRPLDPEMLAPAIIAGAVAGKRRMAAGEQDLWTSIVRIVAAERAGGGAPSAVEPGTGATPDARPILSQSRELYALEGRLKKVLAAISDRVGADRVVLGVNDFSAAGATPGTIRELLAAIGRRGGVSLDRMYDDYFAGRALPVLTLEGVQFTRNGSSWTVRGTLRNQGTGEVFCPIVLRTAFESARTVVRVDSNEAVPFELTTPFQPRSVQLDPEQVCYRWARVGTVETVDYGSER